MVATSPSRDTIREVSRRLQRALAEDRPPVRPGPQDPARAAEVAGLHHTSPDQPGIRRVRSGKGFAYRRPGGRLVRDSRTLARIASLAIPPAWTEVWICPDPDGHVQAVGRDARRRKQYRYHRRWREVRDRSKFGRMIAFAQALPRIRRAVAADLRASGLPRRKVLAAVIRLLEATSIRVGNDEYARANRHFGLTTLLDRHAQIRGPSVRFRFTGKSGKEHTVGLEDPRLSRIVRDCQEIPGQRLFQYLEETGEPRPVTSGDVNDYLRTVSGDDFTAKDFRTWAGTTAVAAALLACGEPKTVAAAKREILAAIDAVAERLGNTRAVCRGSYVHPAVLDAFQEGWMEAPPRPVRGQPPRGLDPIEVATWRILVAAAHPRGDAVKAGSRSRRRSRRSGST